MSDPVDGECHAPVAPLRPPPIRIVGVIASPRLAGRTGTAVEGVLAGAAARGAATSVLHLAETKAPTVADALAGADGFVLGSPVYRATYSSLLGNVLESVERSPGSPLLAKPVAVVMTAAAPEHFLATERLVAVLSGFFASLCLAPALCVSRDAFDGGRLRDDQADLTRLHGEALHDLAAAVRDSPALRSLRPLV